MVGHAFFSERFSNRFRELLEEEIDDFGVPNMFWESFYNKHRKELTLFVNYYKENEIQEFESIDDLRDCIKCILERERIDARSGAA